MKIKNIIKYVVLSAFAGVGAGTMNSCNYLEMDSYIYDMTNIDSVFKRPDLLKSYLIGAASYLPAEDKLFTESWFPYGLSTDECFPSWNDSRHAGIKMMRNEIDAFNTYFFNYEVFYKGIRQAGNILARMGECAGLSEIERRDIAGRAYFLRGYYYYKLLEQYGPVPLVPDVPFSTDESVGVMSVERATYDQCVEKICEDMENAYAYLDESRPSSQQFQPTKGAALAVMSRVRLYQASPWFNGNTFYSNWKRKDGTPFISQEKDPAKWGKAAVVAKRLIDMNKYSLNIVMRTEETVSLPGNVSTSNFPDGAGDIDPFLSYSSIFNGEVAPINNPELIYYCSSITGGDSPAWIAFPKNMNGGNGLNVTQNLVDAYQMFDGSDINNSSAEFAYPASGQYADGMDDDAIGVSGEDMVLSDQIICRRKIASKMYQNREMRFYATIAFNGSYWEGSSLTNDENGKWKKNLYLEYAMDGNQGTESNLPDDCNRTGYTCKKYIHREDHLKGQMRDKVFPIFRYAEILLNYAEALNELESPYTDETTGITVSRDAAEILGAYNQIRYRAGLPGLSILPGQEEMRKLIKHERQIEFALEGRRYHDLRRWGQDAMDELNKPYSGLNLGVRKNERAKLFTPTILTSSSFRNTAVLAKKEFTPKMYFMPIPKAVINRNTNMVQNPGY